MFSCSQILHVVLACVCLTLKTNIPVSLLAIPVLHQPHEPLQHIQHVKNDIEPLPHLSGMYCLMVQQPRCHSAPLSHQQHTTYIDGCESSERDNVVSYYFHKFL